MKTQHTKGTWASQEGQIYIEETGKTIALIPYFDKDNTEQEATARLMASAPALLDALDNFVQLVDICTGQAGRSYMQAGRLEAYDSIKSSLTYRVAIDAIIKAIG